MNLEGSSTPTPRVAAVTVEMSFQMKAGTIMSDSILTRYLHALEQILCRRGENRYFTLPTLKRRYFSTLKRGTVPNSIDHNKTDDACPNLVATRSYQLDMVTRCGCFTYSLTAAMRGVQT
jgi:hypothetical protein